MNAVRAALWGRDLARARLAADRLDADPASDPGVSADRIAARAGIAALEGHTDSSVTGYRDALARQRHIDADLAVALTGLDFVLLIGADDPATREAEAESRAILERVKATFYLDELEGAIRAGAPAERRVAVDQVAAATDS